MTSIILPSHVSPLSRLNRTLRNHKRINCKQLIFIVDNNTLQSCLPLVSERLSAVDDINFIEIPEGEEAKNINVVNDIWSTLIQMGCDRDTTIVNLGGGALSDVGGFVAATYMRGIPFINIPTTLLSMIDASIGGKTAVNVGGIKNSVGVFATPEIVCVDPVFLQTLPKQQLMSGLFELIKTLMLHDPEAYRTLTDEPDMGSQISPRLIAQCASFKQNVVAMDFRDSGIRHILNLGHTFAHGLEAHTAPSEMPLLHGEAVALGIKCALYLSMKKLGFPSEEYDRYSDMLKRQLFYRQCNLRESEQVMKLMAADKKRRGNEWMCVLLQEIGVPVIDVCVDSNEIRDALLHL